MSGTGIGRFAGRERRLAAAQRAFGALPPQQRRALALRYVDGLPAQDVAARLGVTPDEADALLATARSELLRTPRRPLARPLAAAAVVVAAVAVALPDGPALVRTPGSGSPDPAAAAPVVGGEAILHAGDAAGAMPVALAGGARGASLRVPAGSELVADAGVQPPGRPGRPCGTLCGVGETTRGDMFTVSVPEPVREPVGKKEVVLEQEHVPLCGKVPVMPESPVVRCVPGSA